MGAGPKTVVPSPPAQPPNYGLLKSVEPISDPNLRWANGILYSPETCGDGGAAAPCDVGTLTIDERSTSVDVEPFWVWHGDVCSAFGFGEQDFKGRARRALEAVQSYQIERELWTGELADAQGWTTNPRLADLSGDDLTEGSSVGLTHGMACLEQYLASVYWGRPGMIHATPQVVTHWMGLDLIRHEGDKLVTAMGTVVVPGAGYQGTNPSGTIGDNNIWAYATGMVSVRLGEIAVWPDDFDQALDREDNTIRFFAARPTTVEWDGCALAGVQLAVTQCSTGGS